MIEFEHKLDGVKPEVITAIKEFWKNLSPHSVQVLAGKCSEEEAKIIVAQGHSLKEVNELRANAKLSSLDIKTNKTIAKPRFAEYLKKGDGALVVVKSNGFRHKTNKLISNAYEWVQEKHPSVTIDVTDNDKYHTYFFYIKKKKEKEEKDEQIIEQPIIEEIQPNEGA